MTDRLRQLLDPKPTDDEIGMAGDCGCDGSYMAGLRLALVRETMRECAKVMCSGCRDGRDYDDGYHCWSDSHHPELTKSIPCKAYPIIHALRQNTEGMAEKGTDNG